MLIVEAPDTSRRRSGLRALQSFAERFDLRTRDTLMGYANDTQQEIALLYDGAVLTARHDPREGDGAPRFDSAFEIDLDLEGRPERVTWSKPPLEAALETPLGPLRLIGVHAKSKAPHGARTRAEITATAIANRRKQLAQCLWLRARVAAHLAAGEALVVLGDFNDGPGLDEYEALFGRSGVEIVLGEGDAPRLFDPHARAALTSRLTAGPSTARFRLPPVDGHPGRYLSALLDYVMVSPDLVARGPRWRIWHPFDDPECWADPDLRHALLTASDHFPVTLDLA